MKEIFIANNSNILGTAAAQPVKKGVKVVRQPSTIKPRIVAGKGVFSQTRPSLDSLVNIDLPIFSTTTTTTTTKKPRTSKPRPPKKAPAARAITASELTCPKPEQIPFQWFPLPCDNHKQCKSMGKNYRCCELNSNSYKTCTKGMYRPIPEQKHSRE